MVNYGRVQKNANNHDNFMVTYSQTADNVDNTQHFQFSLNLSHYYYYNCFTTLCLGLPR